MESSEIIVDEEAKDAIIVTGDFAEADRKGAVGESGVGCFARRLLRRIGKAEFADIVQDIEAQGGADDGDRQADKARDERPAAE